jgi:hypothetical protein
MSLFIRTLLFLLPILTTVRGQSCGNLNSQDNCNIIATPLPESTIYYDPASTASLVIRAKSVGTCDGGSRAQVTLFYSQGAFLSFIAECGCLLLDGVDHDLVCSPAGKISHPFNHGTSKQLLVCAGGS